MKEGSSLEVRTRETSHVSRHTTGVGVVERGVDLVEDEKRRRVEAVKVGVSVKALKSTKQETHEWMAKRRANAAIVFSPPDSLQKLILSVPSHPSEFGATKERTRSSK